jgi:hypothetical protein
MEFCLCMLGIGPTGLYGPLESHNQPISPLVGTNNPARQENAHHVQSHDWVETSTKAVI